MTSEGSFTAGMQPTQEMEKSVGHRNVYGDTGRQKNSQRERERAVNRYVVMTCFGNVEKVWVNLKDFWICPRIFRKFVKFLETCSEILGTTKKYLDMSAHFQKCRETS